jgi:DNA-binding transcriptional MerR regulator
LINADVDAAIFNHLGIKQNQQEEKNLPKICKICDVPNASDSSICSKCGKPLDLAKSIELDEKNQEQIKSQNEKITILEKSVESLQNALKTQEKEIVQSMQDYLDELERKIQNPKFFEK